MLHTKLCRIYMHKVYCQLAKSLTFIGLCIIVIAEEKKTNLMSLAILFHFLCAQHVSDINVSVLQAEACNTDTTPTQPH